LEFPLPPQIETFPNSFNLERVCLNGSVREIPVCIPKKKKIDSKGDGSQKPFPYGDFRAYAKTRISTPSRRRISLEDVRVPPKGEGNPCRARVNVAAGEAL